MRRIPILNPCANKWEDLVPRANGRYCSQCDKVVVDFTRLTKKQATDLIRNSTERVCARILVDERGEPVHRAEQTRTSHARAGLAAGSLLVAACSHTEPPAVIPNAAASPPAAGLAQVHAPIEARSPEQSGPACSTPAECAEDRRRHEQQEAADRERLRRERYDEFMGEAPD